MRFNVGDRVRVDIDSLQVGDYKRESLKGVVGTVFPSVEFARWDVDVQFPDGSVLGFMENQLVRVSADELSTIDQREPADQLMGKYAGELMDIYTRRTAVGNTFVGVLAEFMREMKEHYDIYLR